MDVYRERSAEVTPGKRLRAQPRAGAGPGPGAGPRLLPGPRDSAPPRAPGSYAGGGAGPRAAAPAPRPLRACGGPDPPGPAMTPAALLRALPLVVLLLLSPARAVRQARRPNVVLILTDDQDVCLGGMVTPRRGSQGWRQRREGGARRPPGSRTSLSEGETELGGRGVGRGSPRARGWARWAQPATGRGLTAASAQAAPRKERHGGANAGAMSRSAEPAGLGWAGAGPSLEQPLPLQIALETSRTCARLGRLVQSVWPRQVLQRRKGHSWCLAGVVPKNCGVVPFSRQVASSPWTASLQF